MQQQMDQVELTQEDLDAVEKMFALAEQDEDEEKPLTDEELIKAFADGTGIFQDL